MGIPKFFRWLSERYPLCSQLVSEHSVPEFDNFYLDMNGIIHNCARSITSNSGGGSSYSESEIFLSIFTYLQTLFEKIRPKKVLFLAIDGVAPRAKLNQQRSRRFRSAKESQMEVEKAAARQKHSSLTTGNNNAPFTTKTLPNTTTTSCTIQERFDSNCITPGTEFMLRLSEHLRYFISKKVAEDVAWRNVQIVFSGPDVPGEGEHKIMEYIRLNKAKPEYDPNVRHCLYGLDADLILLGLLSHDPHFALLREEVTFGRGANSKNMKNAADLKFFLLHLCLIREYMDLEFQQSFQDTHQSFSLERLIDDFILLMCFVGNDFLPSLPNFHLGEGVLETLFAAYKKTLQSTNGGHLNENGKISFQRLANVLRELVEYEENTFITLNPTLFVKVKEGEQKGGSKGGHGSKGQWEGKEQEQEQEDSENNETIKVLGDLINYFSTPQDPLLTSTWSSSGKLGAKGWALLEKVAREFHLQLQLETNGGRMTIKKSPGGGNLHNSIELVKTLKQQLLDLEKSSNTQMQEAFTQCKRTYYQEKIGFDSSTKIGIEALNQLMQSYGEGLQWNMLYYYEGVASWSWFYPCHYSPHISDLAKFFETFVCPLFELGQPLTPLEQLMAVLPPASAPLVPKALAWLMTAAESPVRQFYPSDFTTDSNGKKASWEAIVKIPFIDENLLLPVLRSRYNLLDAKERARNEFGMTFTYEFQRPGRHLKSPSADFPEFSTIPVHEVPYELPVLGLDERFVAKLCQGARLGLHSMPGFPTLATLPVTGVLDSGIGLDIFGQGAKGLSMVLAVKQGGVFDQVSVAAAANQIVGKLVYINWPHLREGRVACVTDGCHRYERDNQGNLKVTEILSSSEFDNFSKICESIQREYRRSCAVLTGPIDALAWVYPFDRMFMTPDGALKKQFSDSPVPCALQTLVIKRVDMNGCKVEDSRYEEVLAKTVNPSALFPVESTIVYLGLDAYGQVGTVVGPGDNPSTVKVKLPAYHDPEPSFPLHLAQNALVQIHDSFITASEVSRRVGISGLLLSKITSTLSLFLDESLIRSSNIGLNIKSEAKQICALGLARRGFTTWEYAPQVVQLLAELKSTFPLLLQRLEQEKASCNIDAARIFPGEKDLNKQTLMDSIAPIRALIQERLGEVVHVPLGGEYLDSKAVNQVKAAWAEYSTRPKRIGDKELCVGIQLILSLATATPRLVTHHQKFELGHRIVYVGTGSIPFGAAGIVIGRDKGHERLSVLLDNPIIGGSNLDGLCPEGWGASINHNECINISLPQPPPVEIGPEGIPGKSINESFNNYTNNNELSKSPWSTSNVAHSTTRTRRWNWPNQNTTTITPSSIQRSSIIVHSDSTCQDSKVGIAPSPYVPPYQRRSINVETLFKALDLNQTASQTSSSSQNQTSLPNQIKMSNSNVNLNVNLQPKPTGTTGVVVPSLTFPPPIIPTKSTGKGEMSSKGFRKASSMNLEEEDSFKNSTLNTVSSSASITTIKPPTNPKAKLDATTLAASSQEEPKTLPHLKVQSKDLEPKKSKKYISTKTIFRSTTGTQDRPGDLLCPNLQWQRQEKPPQ